MPRHCWRYSDGIPVVEVGFQLADASGRVKRTLEVDCGASGGVTSFVLDEETANLLGIADGPPVRDMDANGNVAIRRTVWALVDMRQLNLREPMLAKCYPRAPGAHQGLATLNSLDGYFTRWCGEQDAGGARRFCLQRGDREPDRDEREHHAR